MELIQIVFRMLKEHYDYSKVPSVLYRGEKKHIFTQPKPYYFQYEGQALNDIAINS